MLLDIHLLWTAVHVKRLGSINECFVLWIRCERHIGHAKVVGCGNTYKTSMHTFKMVEVGDFS